MDHESREDEERRILRKHLETAFGFLLIGTVYYIWLRLTGIGIPCMFHKITGWSCPGCGMTTLIMSLLSGDIAGARAANPFIFFTWPVLVVELLWSEVKTIKGLGHDRGRAVQVTDRVMNVILVIYVAAFVLFGILRNVIR